MKEAPVGPERTLQLLDEGSQFSVASVSGLKDPVVLLDSKFVWALKQACRSAKDEAVRLQPTCEVGSMLKLCEEMGQVFEKYESARNKYYGGPSQEVQRLELQQVERELAELRKLLGIE